jgi:AcrR family transcriptional regulator
MPPKVKFTRDEVIRAAFEVIGESALRHLTARSVAGKLGSSTAPVYRHFSSMDKLAFEVVKRIQRLLLEYTTRSYTDRVFLNMGTGVAMFACEHGPLYRVLLLEGNNYRDVVNEFLGILEKELANDQRFTSLSNAERHTLLHKMWTFTHGLASLICVGLIKDCSQASIIETLMDVGSDVIGATMAKHAKNKTQGN